MIATLLEKINQYYLQHQHTVNCHLIDFSQAGLMTQGLSYAELVEKSLRVANYLSEIGEVNERVIISIENPHWFLIAFIGVLAAKQIAVPVPPFRHFKSINILGKRINGIVDDCQPKVILVEDLFSWQQVEFNNNNARKLDIKILLAMPAGKAKLLPRVNLNDDAYLQYTSGSTGQPKGVVITHKNMVSNILAIGKHCVITEDKLLSWLPLYHDMGLICGLLMPVYWQLPVYSFTPQQFIARPVVWLQAIAKFRISITIGPTFAYHLIGAYVSDKTLRTLDLSCLKVAYIGAEPIPVEIINKFIERLQLAKLRPETVCPCYGLAEATLAVSVSALHAPISIDNVDRNILKTTNKALKTSDNSTASVSFVSVGQVIADHEIYIMNTSTGQLCVEREVGEICVKGPSVASAYFGHGPSVKILKTGDIGYIADNQLYVIDRIKDIIIIAGQNYYPADIENCLTKLTELEGSKAISFPAPGKSGMEELHLIIEVKKCYLKNSATIEQMKKSINKHIYNEYNVTLGSIKLVPRGTFERTSSGKVMRTVYKSAITA